TALLAVGFFLTVLGHYGMMLAALAVMGLFGLWALVTLRTSRQSGAWLLIGAFVGSLALSVVLYYRNFGSEIWGQLSGLLRRVGGEQSGNAMPSRSSGADVGTIARGLAQKVQLLVGLPALIVGIAGAVLTASLERTARALLFSWLAAYGLFVLLDQALG